MAHHVAAEVRDHATGLVRLSHGSATHARGLRHAAGHHAGSGQAPEYPAGTVANGAPTAYDPLIGAAQARSTYAVNGSGMTVAVIDTGVDYNNAALGSGFGPGAKVIAGFDFADNSSDPLATTSQHGTAVAGLIGSSDGNDLGVAPGVQIVALRVTDSSNTASLASIAGALQWVIDHHAQYNITAVNMSLSDGRNYAQNWFANGGGPAQQITDLIGRLTAMNIPTVAATGNSFDGKAQGEGFAAIVNGTISVTATDLSDHLLSNAQRLGTAIGGASATTIAAPGVGTAPSGDSGTASVEGTSFATPLVTGAVVLLQQIYQSRFGTLPSIDQLKSWLQQGADPVYDPATGITIGRLDIPQAAALIPQPTSQPTPVIPTSPATATPPPAPVVAAPVMSAPAAAPAPPGSQVTTTVTVFSANPPSASTGSSSNGTAATVPNFEDLFRSLSVWTAANGNGGWTTGAAHVRVWSA